MSYKIDVRVHPDHVHLVITGENTPENVRGYILEIHDLCIRHNRTNVLIEENLRGPSLSLTGIFEIVTEGTDRTRGVVHNVAYVDINPEHQQSRLQFAEDVAVNRGIQVKLCATVPEGEAWLASLRPQ